MLTRFREYLDFIDVTLDNLFKAQAPFIRCKKGCDYCCKEGEYPISELEFVNMMFAYNDLDENVKDLVNEKVYRLLAKKREKMYECPFLINGTCSIYDSRAIICRTFGLISYDKTGHKRMPFCVDLGLNYSNVYDKNTQKITSLADNGVEPVAYNIGRNFLRSSKFEKEFNIFFGEDKPLIDWLEEEFK